MSRYTRTTRKCLVSQLHPDLSQAIGEFFQARQLGDPETETRSCCETTAVKPASGKLLSFLEGNLDTSFHLAILLTSDWLIWARSGDRSGLRVMGAKLKTIRTKAFVTRRTNEMQLEVSGYMDNSSELARGTLELGPEATAQRFCEEVVETVLRENPPEKRSRPRMFGV